ncbi:MAG: aldehyde dehydrogenase family protein [Chloroflexi bacterium]|nr:aldehyde dehydrogenase family protein [Chloroflexota bacterium]MBK6709952.1 aldehyde dehydrogenase family protein [Chloroflexota bacterium]MBK7178749.1 aldehyde dehydrogenase family protein [Chloroflexota bacterium]MBK8932541.1 aldehyde dehydrogenase family protein [Chloroflexota bacterium]MBP7593528.1 aldehyde dehydrogenase family protein [Chloroflexota bacterium]
MSEERIKVTYSTLSSPNPRLHQLYDEAVERAKANFGKNYPLFINGEERFAEKTFAKHSPINLDWVMGHFQYGTEQDVDDAIAAARAAFPKWSGMPWQERIAIMRKAADLISDRLFDMGANMSLEIGKNRLEALGDVEETADLIRYNCDAIEKNNNFAFDLLAESDRHHNRSVLKPYGVWVVISPFNFPGALAGGPAGAALIAGNTVVLKPATDTPLTSWFLTECFRDAGVPAGAFNFITGSGRVVGERLVTHPGVDGITFTGSYDVGMHILRTFAQGRYPRPVIAEMGGKNPTIITNKADLDKAAMGVMRSAFGLQGQKCSACSRVYVHADVKDAFMEKLLALTKEIHVGDPTQKENWMGPVANKGAFEDYKKFVADLRQDGEIVFGGEALAGNGYFAAPTIVDNLPHDHYLWKQEMFLPIVTVHPFTDLDDAMAKANDVEYGLTAGFFSEDDAEIQWWLNNIQAGVLYVNRASGATTGAWPGYQSFGGWKGSGSTGKAAGSFYYIQQYMHEQSQTIIE